jgi:uncharacterized protein (AIM24 family)
MTDDLPPALRRGSPNVSTQKQPAQSPDLAASPVSESAQEPKKKPYKIIGDDIQFVELELQPQAAVVGEVSSLMYYDDGINVKVRLLESEQQQAGLLTRLFGLGKNMVTGRRLFMTTFLNQSQKPLTVAFAAQYPGTIVPISLKTTRGLLFCLQSAFLCASRNTQMSSASQRELGGSFRNTGVTMQKLEGDGMVFLHAGGSVEEMTLAPGQVIHASVGAAMAIEPTVKIHLQKIRNVGLACDGHDLVELTGPGKVWLQSLPFPLVRKNIAFYTQQLLLEA